MTDGKFITQIDPQARFPFPLGVVNNQSANTLAIDYDTEYASVSTRVKARGNTLQYNLQ
jgi:hypothetical protein